MNIHLQTFESSHFPISQEHPLGCGAACVASLCHMPYQQALRYFQTPEHAWIRGFYCVEVVEALNRMGMNYAFDEFNNSKHENYLHQVGTIVFVAPCEKYPAGHYFLRTSDGWMNPWSNFPQMSPTESQIEQTLPGKVSYVIYSLL